MCSRAYHQNVLRSTLWQMLTGKNCRQIRVWGLSPKSSVNSAYYHDINGEDNVDNSHKRRQMSTDNCSDAGGADRRCTSCRRSVDSVGFYQSLRAVFSSINRTDTHGNLIDTLEAVGLNEWCIGNINSSR